jgi:hypothetical protein
MCDKVVFLSCAVEVSGCFYADIFVGFMFEISDKVGKGTEPFLN